MSIAIGCDCAQNSATGQKTLDEMMIETVNKSPP